MTSVLKESHEGRPLCGVRVLDFSRVLAGPYCTALLADLGAEVIKVEPKAGDDQRHMGVLSAGVSANFELINRNKRSIRLDLKSNEGRSIAVDLAKQVDVVVENFRPGVTNRLGIDYNSLKECCPTLVYCSISGFGQDGPLAERPSYDVVAQAMSGFMSVTGEPDRPPVFAGDSIGDTVSGLFAAWGICAALFHRERTGQGQYLDIAMFDSLLSLLPTALSQYFMTGKAPGRSGNRHPLSAPFGTFKARDGHYILAVANATLFQRLAEAMRNPGIVADPRFANDQSRSKNEAALREIIEEWSASRTVNEVVDTLSLAGVPCSSIWSVSEAADSLHAEYRQLFNKIEHPLFGSFRVPEQPVHFGNVPRGGASPAPNLGADGESILRNVLNYPEEVISDLVCRELI